MPINLMIEIEKREGKPMRDILMETYPLYDKQAAVANALGISQPTLSQWISRLGLQEKTILVQRESTAMVAPVEPATSPAAYPHSTLVEVSA